MENEKASTTPQVIEKRIEITLRPPESGDTTDSWKLTWKCEGVNRLELLGILTQAVHSLMPLAQAKFE